MTQERVSAIGTVYSRGNSDEYIYLVINHPDGDIDVRINADGRCTVLITDELPDHYNKHKLTRN